MFNVEIKGYNAQQIKERMDDHSELDFTNVKEVRDHQEIICKLYECVEKANDTLVERLKTHGFLKRHIQEAERW